METLPYISHFIIDFVLVHVLILRSALTAASRDTFSANAQCHWHQERESVSNAAQQFTRPRIAGPRCRRGSTPTPSASSAKKLDICPVLVLITPEAFTLMVCTVKVHAWGKLCSHIKRMAMLSGVVGVYTGLF